MLNTKKCLLIVLFFSISGANNYACTPKGHVKFNNRTDIPITIVITRKDKNKKDQKETEKEMGIKKYTQDAGNNEEKITIKSHKASNEVCWITDSHLLNFKAFFYRDGISVQGPSGEFSKIKRTFLGFSSKVESHEGNQEHITSSGCSKRSKTCTVDFKMNKMENK